MRNRNKALLLAPLLCAVLVVLGLFGYYAASIQVPQQRQVLPCPSWASRAAVTIPPGSTYDLVLGVPYPASSPVVFAGLVTISRHGRIVCTFPISVENSTQCNWLDSPALAGYILTWQQSHHVKLDQLLDAGQSYDLSVRWSQRPPSGSSVWLTWLQRGRDKFLPGT